MANLLREQENMLRSLQAANPRDAYGLGLGFNPTLNETRIEKGDLLKVLRENLAKHKAEFETAMNDYWEALEIYHSTQLERAKSKNKKGPDVPAPAMPTSQEKEYEKVIRQLELSIDDKIVLNDTQFQTYVMDDWFWKSTFTMNNQTLAMYKSIDRGARG
jgi:hypothetical protein